MKQRLYQVSALGGWGVANLALFVAENSPRQRQHHSPPPPTSTPTMSIPGTWTADELMHGKEDDSAAAAVASLTISPHGSPTSKPPSKRFSMAKLGKKKPPADPMDWGMPGHLTDEEVAVFVSSFLFLFLLLLLSLSLLCGRLLARYCCRSPCRHCSMNRFVRFLVAWLWRIGFISGKDEGNFAQSPCCGYVVSHWKSRRMYGRWTNLYAVPLWGVLLCLSREHSPMRTTVIFLPLESILSFVY
jgi:hypothetical protein